MKEQRKLGKLQRKTENRNIKDKIKRKMKIQKNKKLSKKKRGDKHIYKA